MVAMHGLMKRYLMPLLAAVTVLVMMPSAGRTCSYVSHFADPPEAPKAFDSKRAPEAPTILEASVNHQYRDEGCQSVGDSCNGEQHTLSLVVSTSLPVEKFLLRIRHADGSTVFAQGHYVDENGEMYISLPGYSDISDDTEMRFAMIDDEGYPSNEVPTLVINIGGDGSGCEVGNRAGSALPFALALLVLVLWSRKRTLASTDRR